MNIVTVDDLEKQVKAGSYEVKGRALKQLLEGGLLPAGCNVDSYCKAAFGFSVERAKQFIGAAEVFDNIKALQTSALLLPASEAQARPLVNLPPDQQALIWDWAMLNFPGGDVTADQLRQVASQVKEFPDQPIQFITAADMPDTKWPSDNDLDIPLLNPDWQALAVDLPLVLWGSKARHSVTPGTVHFYTDDYRFEALWDDPSVLINSRCFNAVEPNFSIYDNTARIVGLYRIYLKRYLARCWQHFGVRILVDLNVSSEFYVDNLLGVPAGWASYSTRGYADRLALLDQEYDLACGRAGTKNILFVVYGGGRKVKETAQRHGWLWFAEHRQGGDNGEG